MKHTLLDAIDKLQIVEAPPPAGSLAGFLGLEVQFVASFKGSEMLEHIGGGACWTGETFFIIKEHRGVSRSKIPIAELHELSHWIAASKAQRKLLNFGLTEINDRNQACEDAACGVQFYLMKNLLRTGKRALVKVMTDYAYFSQPWDDRSDAEIIEQTLGLGRRVLEKRGFGALLHKTPFGALLHKTP